MNCPFNRHPKNPKYRSARSVVLLLSVALALTACGGDEADYPAGAKWVSIPTGTFQMGCSPNDDDCADDERPVHLVTLSAFDMLETEVTEGQYEAVTGSNPSIDRKGANYPVETLTWSQAQAFCEAIGGRLPTEAEWEYAARAGTTARFYCGDDYHCLAEVAWHYGNSGGTKHPVASKAPNAFGLYDMLGNAWEWTNDWCGDYGPEAQTNPAGPDHGLGRALRGGRYDDGGGGGAGVSLRVSDRDCYNPTLDYYALGLRCVRDAP